MNQQNAQGSCLCGSITLHVPSLPAEVGICHCNTCRKWAAGPSFTIECGSDVRIEGEEHLGVYPSSDWAERAFCKRCGSPLFYRLKEDGTMAVSAGLFAQAGLRLEKQIFIEEKPGYYEFANETPKMTGEEVFAAYAAKESDRE